MKQQFSHSVYMGMDKDTDVRNMNTKAGFHPEARNIHMEPLKSPSSMDGTVELGPSLPGGINTPVGSYWDRREDTRFDFWHNSNGDHSIVRHMVKEGRFDVIVQSPTLNFSKDHLITGIGLVDGQYLYWTDDLNQSRMVDIERAQDDGTKKAEYRVFIPSHIEAQNRQFNVKVIDPSGATVVSLVGLYTAGSVEISEYTSMLKGFETAWNSVAALNNRFTATACNDWIDFDGHLNGRYSVEVEFIDTINAVVQPAVIAYGEFRNYYNSEWEREQMDFGAFVPYKPPVATIDNIQSSTSNMIDRRVIRFAYSYIFRDRGYSPMSPWSKPVANQQSCLTSALGNIANVSFIDDTNLDKEWCRGEVDFIELYYQEGTENGWPRDWKSAGRFAKDEWVYTREIEFTNKQVSVAVDVSYSDLFSFSTPHTAKAATQIVDQDSNNRILLANTMEGHDTPCLNVDLDLEIDEQAFGPRYVDLEVHIRICNMFAYPAISSVIPVLIQDAEKYWTSQPIWQRDPEGPYRIGGMGNAGNDDNPRNQITKTGGIPVYIAGKDVVAVTEQVVTYLTPTAQNQTQFVTNTTVLDGTTLGNSVNPSQRSGRAGIRDCIENGDIYQKAILRGVQTGQTIVIRIASPECSFLDDGSLLDLNSPDLLYQKTSTNIFGIGNVNPAYVQNFNIASRELVVTIPTNATGTLLIGEFLYADNTVPEDLAVKTLPVDMYLFDDDGNDYANPGNDIRQTGIPMTRTYVGAVTYDFANIPSPLTATNVTYFPPGFAQYSFINNRCKGADYWSNRGYTFLDQIYRQFRNVTDHNGYTWIPVRKWRYWQLGAPLLFKWRMAAISVSGNGLSGTVNGNATNFAYSLNNINVTNLTVVNDLDGKKWYPSGPGEFSLTAPALTDEVFLDVTGQEYRSYVVGNINADQDENDSIKTIVKGRVLENGTNTPVDNVSVVITNGGWTRSANGDWQVVLHGAMNKNFIIGNNDNDRVEDRPIFGWNGACTISWLGGSSYGNLINIFRYLVGQQYSMNIPYQYGDIFIIQQTGLNGPFLKRWGLYDVGIIGVDQHGNPTPVQFLKRFEIPGINDDLHDYDPVKYPVPGTYKRGNATINWSINSPVPVPEYNRFRYFQFVITPEQSTDRYLQWAVSNVLYVSRWDPTSQTPVVSGYGANATEIYLSFGDSFQRFREINADSATVSSGTTLNQFGQVGWSYQPGDRIRIITKGDGTYQDSPIDVELLGQRGVYLVINNDNNIPEMTGGELVELYRPGKTPGEAKYYNEVVGVQAVVSDPFGNPDWVNSTGDTASGTAIMGADAWGIASSIPIRPGFISTGSTPNVSWRSRIYFRQSMSVTDFWPSKVDALGRVAVEDPQAKQQRRGTIIRISNSYLPGTSRNGLRLFEPLNNKVANTDYGLIMHMEEMDQVIVCPCSGSRTFAVYLSRELVNSGDTDLITIGSKILGTMRPMAWRFGTVNPESIVRGDTFMFWVDALAGAVVRYDVNGVKSISRRGIGNYFAKYCREYTQFNGYRFYGGFNAEFSEYLITTKLIFKVQNGIDIDRGGDTFTFWFANSDEAETANKWSCFMDWTPEYYGRSAGRMYSMKNGAVHLHDADPDKQNVVYGVKFPMSVDMLFNENPVIKKVFLAVQANNGPGWYSPEITTPEGQASNLIEADYVMDEGVAKAGLLRDLNTPVQLPLINGDMLRSSALTVRFSNNATSGKAILNSAGIHYRTSPET